MTATSLLADLPSPTRPEAERWIAAALAEAGALHQYDNRLYPLTDDPAVMAEARRFHAA